MAITNYERVGKALDLLRGGLLPFVERECSRQFGKYWITKVTEGWQSELSWPEGAGLPNLDAAFLLRVMWDQWNAVFRETLGFSERSLVSELRDVRNRWAHQNPFTTDDAYRALDSSARLLTAISAPQADEIEKMKLELLRRRFDEQVRDEKRKSAGTTIEGAVTAHLKPWREVVTPHKDVASGRYQQAEFAADLWQVHLGQGTDEYRDPVEFFRRTYLTESLKGLLAGAVRRLSGQGGDPVIQLQTNFGGGKTHSMLALYHLFSGVSPTELAGVEAVLRSGVTGPLDPASKLPTARRVVLVGNKISPGNPSIKPDGTRVCTLWGELAWQLGGAQAFERVRADDERATSPGDVLRELFNQYGPCLILIDEWVAYARQLHDQSDLPAGSFETQFSFAQVLTESAKLAPNCLLVISLPASDTTGSPHTQADNAEVGGQRGREALDRLRNVVGRVESSWRPASAEEGFEIVRRRLFEPLSDPAQFKDRDVVARTFADFYRVQSAEFPPECHDADYEARLKAAYPIHPEIFDRLYTDWSTLVKFQRTRGVLRLMAAVIHSLWEKGDRNPLILPANIPIDDPRVQFELTRYLSDNWVPVIEKDVDGPGSLPLRMDGEVPNLGKFAACRRVARTIYLGSAPLTQAAHRGLEDRRVKLGCVMPGESPAVFGDALRRLAGAATYLYQDGQRFWYSTQPTVTKLAEDRADQLKREPDKIARELEKRLRADLAHKGDFARVHPLPQSGGDVPDDYDARLVVLDTEHPYSKDPGNPAEAAARAILEFRGSVPRLFQNTLVFLAADRTRLQDLDEATRRYLAWESILNEKEGLNLDPQQVKQAETQKVSADGVVTARLPETYQWLLVPVQATPQSPLTWQSHRLNGNEPLAVRAGKKLKNDELLLMAFAGTRLRMELDRIPLWRGDHVAVKTLVEDFARYTYLPRLRDASVLLEAIRDGVALLTWQKEGFALADSYDEAGQRYRGLRAGQTTTLFDPGAPNLVVKADIARAQIEAESQPAPHVDPSSGTRPTPPGAGPSPAVPGSPPAGGPTPPVPVQPRRFHGTVTLDSARVGRDAGRIAEEVIAHLVALMGADVTVSLEIEANVPAGVPDDVVRTVTENARTLKFSSQGFEQE
ncbi:MAG: Swt1 family HEPN domain-containing protein [Anaerolineaceae bacterium]|nr:Swt1 family HEPN domain-containing protein [Anaerolineaceae bacterium]